MKDFYKIGSCLLFDSGQLGMIVCINREEAMVILVGTGNRVNERKAPVLLLQSEQYIPVVRGKALKYILPDQGLLCFKNIKQVYDNHANMIRDGKWPHRW